MNHMEKLAKERLVASNSLQGLSALAFPLTHYYLRVLAWNPGERKPFLLQVCFIISI